MILLVIIYGRFHGIVEASVRKIISVLLYSEHCPFAVNTSKVVADTWLAAVSIAAETDTDTARNYCISGMHMHKALLA